MENLKGVMIKILAEQKARVGEVESEERQPKGLDNKRPKGHMAKTIEIYMSNRDAKHLRRTGKDSEKA